MLTLNPEEASVQIFMKFHEVLKSLLMVIKQKTLAFTPYNNFVPLSVKSDWFIDCCFQGKNKISVKVSVDAIFIMFIMKKLCLIYIEFYKEW